MATRQISAARRTTRIGSIRSVPGRHRIRAALLPAESRQVTVLLVRWGLVAVCLFLFAAGDGASPLLWPAGFAIVATMAASNLAVARLRPEYLAEVLPSIGIAVLDSLLVVTAWYVSGYESFAPVILSLCLVNLALVGLGFGEITAIAFAASVVYFVTV